MKDRRVFPLTKTGSHWLCVNGSHWVITSESIPRSDFTEEVIVPRFEARWGCRNKLELLECLIELDLDLDPTAVVRLSLLEEGSRDTWAGVRGKNGRRKWLSELDRHSDLVNVEDERVVVLGPSEKYISQVCAKLEKGRLVLRLDERFASETLESGSTAWRESARITKIRGVGRPTYNIFFERDKALSMWRPKRKSLALQRIVILQKRKNWREKFAKDPETGACYAWSRKWEKAGHEWRKPYFHAELAMILCGRNTPEIRMDKGATPKFRPTLYDEFLWLSIFLEDTFNPESKFGMPWRTRGQRPNPEKLYRSGVSILCARKLLRPNGCPPKYLPNPKAISQVWYLLFGEKEPEDAIRKRLPSLGKACRALPRWEARWSQAERSKFRGIGNAIESTYPH